MKAKQPICFHMHAEQVIPDKPGIAVRQAIVFNLLYTTFPVVVYVSAVI